MAEADLDEAVPEVWLSARVRALAEGTFRQFGQFGPDTVSLAIGDPALPPPPSVTEAYARAVAEGRTHYGDYWGDIELRAALAREASAVAGREIGLSQVLVTHGSSAGLSASLLAMLDPGDRVVIPEPTYSLYADVARMAGAVPVLVPLGPDFRLDLDRIAEALPTAKAIVICNPNNPTGVVNPPEEMEALGRIVAESGAWLIADEAYHRLVFDGRPFRSSLALAEIADRTVYVQTFSKTYRMTGLRVGYVVAPAEVLPGIELVHQTMDGCLNPAVQRAALAATEVDEDWVAGLRSSYQARRDLAMERLGADGLSVVPPEGAFYAFIDVGMESTEFAEIAGRHGVAVRAGREFGPSGATHVRICFGDPDEILLPGLDRLSAAVRSPEYLALRDRGR